MEILVALTIFATTIFILIERRDFGLEANHYAVNLLKAQTIVDEVLADYRLHPFSEEPIPIKKDYSPFEVEVSVAQESVNILPEEWRVEIDPDLEEDEKKKRIILRVTVDVGFGTFRDDKPIHHHKISTLIRHIEIDKEEEE